MCRWSPNRDRRIASDAEFSDSLFSEPAFCTTQKYWPYSVSINDTSFMTSLIMEPKLVLLGKSWGSMEDRGPRARFLALGHRHSSRHNICTNPEKLDRNPTTRTQRQNLLPFLKSWLLLFPHKQLWETRFQYPRVQQIFPCLPGRWVLWTTIQKRDLQSSWKLPEIWRSLERRRDDSASGGARKNTPPEQLNLPQEAMQSRSIPKQCSWRQLQWSVLVTQLLSRWRQTWTAHRLREPLAISCPWSSSPCRSEYQSSLFGRRPHTFRYCFPRSVIGNCWKSVEEDMFV